MHYLSSVFLGFVSTVHAQNPDVLNPCPVAGLPCDTAGGSDAAVVTILINGAQIAFASVLFAMLIFYGVRLIMGSDNDSTITETYHSYAYAAIGTILAGSALLFAQTFTIPTQDSVISASPTNVVLNGVITAFKAILYSAVVFNIFYQGFRLVSSQDESQTDKAKKQFIYGLVGAAIVLLAGPLVTGFISANSGVAGVQAVGIANFMGAILGALAVIAMFVSGLYLVFAVNEQNSDKAKKVLTGAIIVLIITMMSLALINITNQIYAPSTT